MLFVISLIFLIVACSHVRALPCCIPGIPLDDSPVAAVDNTVTEAVDNTVTEAVDNTVTEPVDYTVTEPVGHPTVGASMTPTAMRHLAASISLCSF